jgi:O-antigen ligase
MLEQLAPRALQANAITSLLLLLIPLAMLSHLSNANTYSARFCGWELAKTSMFFLLVIGLVNSRPKLVVLLTAVTVFIFVAAVLALLQYYNVLQLAAITSLRQNAIDSDTHKTVQLTRLCGTGLFNDPNDFSLMLSAGIIVCCAVGLETRRWALLMIPLALFGYALLLTQSRGGLMAAIAGVLVLLGARFGWKNGLVLLCLMMPLIAVLNLGRQARIDLDNPENTFQTRLELWSESFDALRSAPLLGIGSGKLVDDIGHVAHNSYLHAYAEMGILGGTAFFGTFYLVLRALRKASPSDFNLARLRPCILGLTVSYGVGLLSLSRCYTVPTQLMLAIATVYLALASRSGPVVLPKLDGACIRRITGMGVVFLSITYVFMRLMLQRGQI